MTTILDSPRQAMSTGPGLRRTKRAFDIVVAALVLALSMPVLVGAMALVIATSPGPALYRQTRVGLAGSRFQMLKIRTMVDDAEGSTGPRLAEPDDPRVTRIGAMLRRTHLDELPQLVNIIRGEMSLVGPRPERPEFVRSFEAQFDRYGQRHTVRPGLTGLAQIKGRYDSTVTEKLEHDLTYVDQRSFATDVAILLRTPLRILRN